MKRILVVDDEPAITRLIKLNLEATGGYEVFTENQGREAVSAARRFKPDLILLDIMMPDMLGSDVAAALAEDAELRNIKVAFLTAMLKKGEQSVSEDGKPTQTIIAKPVSTEELISMIVKILG